MGRSHECTAMGLTDTSLCSCRGEVAGTTSRSLSRTAIDRVNSVGPGVVAEGDRVRVADDTAVGRSGRCYMVPGTLGALGRPAWTPRYRPNQSRSATAVEALDDGRLPPLSLRRAGRWWSKGSGPLSWP